MRNPEDSTSLNRRDFGKVLATSPLMFGRSPAIHVPGPKVTCGVASGDVTGDSAMIWSRSDRPAKMIVEWATNDAFRDARKLAGPVTRHEDDLTSKLLIGGLAPGETIRYRVRFRDPDSAEVVGEAVEGRLRTPPADRSPIKFVWGGDVCGQGWGIDPRRGGMATFAEMKKVEPDFFLHSGDHIYADNPIDQGFLLEDRSIWRNLVTQEVSKVAETLDEFRGRYRYNFLDDPYREFAASTSTLAQWDDHEVLNNWYPGEILEADPRYRVKDVDLLAKRAKQAFFDYQPMRIEKTDPGRIYRKVSYGPNLDVFLLDQRSYRGPNTRNRQETSGPVTAFLGREQLLWLKAALAGSRATWKVIASDMPLGLIITDGPDGFEAVANGNGPPLGRELELADLLKSIKSAGIANIVWLTADVHYAAAHFYDPSKARFTDFSPFWEFVAGPLHAGTFGPGQLDPTFGPTVKFASVDRTLKQGSPPNAGLQFFGVVAIDGTGKTMTVSLKNRAGKTLYTVDLDAT